MSKISFGSRSARWLAGAATLLTAAVAFVTVSTLPSEAASAPAAGGVYTIAATNSGRCIDVTSGSTANGGLLQQWGCHAEQTNQQFRVQAGANSQFNLVNVNSTRCVDVPNGAATAGLQIQQWGCGDGTKPAQLFTFTASGTGTYQIKNVASGMCLAVTGSSTANGAAVVQQACAASTNQQWAFTALGGASDTPVGWATQNGGTTGGSAGTVVTVTTAADLKAALNSDTSQTVRVSGMIATAGLYNVKSNKTIIGVGSGSGFTGGALNLDGVTNVVIRNLVFRNLTGDAINVQNGTTNVWIDHNDLSAGGDGLIDITHGSDFITVSWNVTHNHDKTLLLGHDDANAAEDVGHLRVTYHHNWFNGTNQRHPRVRFGNPVHVYNNLYSNIGSYGVAANMSSGVLVESNYFENVASPYGPDATGKLVARNNHMVNSGAGTTAGSVASIPYAYPIDTASGVKSIVSAGAGVGKIGL